MKGLMRLVLSMLLIINVVSGQGVHGVIGAGAWMHGGISTMNRDAYSVMNNPAMMSDLSSRESAVYSEQRFARREFSLSSANLVFPLGDTRLGVGCNYYGFQLFNQQRYAVSLSRKLAQSFGLGVQFNYVATSISEYGQSGAFLTGAGIYYQPVSKLMLAFMLYNPTQQNLSAGIDEKLPAYARLGLKYRVNEKVHVLAETEVHLPGKYGIRTGIRYDVSPRVTIATGFVTQPVLFTFGTSVRTGKLIIEMGAGIHQVAGVTPHAGVRFPLSAKY